MNLPQIIAQAGLDQASPLMMAVVVFIAIVALIIAIKVAVFIIRVFCILVFLALISGVVWHLMNGH
jgi:hypothetical protein